MLLRMDSLCGKPVCLWLPERFKKPNTSTYVQGVEGLTDYTGPVSEGFDVIELPTADYLMFQGEPFAEEDYTPSFCRPCRDIASPSPRSVPSGTQKR